jgi:hypothetical protein
LYIIILCLIYDYKKKLKRQRDIANFTKKRASRKIIVAYRSALANPNLKECAICLGTMLNPSLTTTLYHCKHIFHTSCIKKWAANKYNIPRCPLCKTQILYYENPSIVKPKKTEQDFMDRLTKVRIWAKYEAEQIAKASAFIARSQEQLINRTARDGSSVRMTRGHKQMLEEQISKYIPNITINSITVEPYTESGDVESNLDYELLGHASIYRIPGANTAEYSAKIKIDYTNDGRAFGSRQFVIINI